MNYKIVVDSCCEIPEQYKDDPRFEIVPLTLEVGDEHIIDDENFDQASFLKKVADCPTCPKSACPSPDSFCNAYMTEAERVYVITLSSHLSGSYNSAVLGMNLYHEQHGDKQIHVVDSESAASGETQIALKLIDLEEQGLPFEEIVEQIEAFRSSVHTYFVLDNLDTLRKNGRLSGVKALVATSLNIKPLMAGDKGVIVQLGQGIGIKKALRKLIDTAVADVTESEERRLIITHCNALDRAKLVADAIVKERPFKEVLFHDARGVSSMYANDGGIVVTT